MALRVLVAGVSTRAMAESAARAGFEVTAVDAFGDFDQHPSVRALALPRDFQTRFTPMAAARAARAIACDAVAYGSSFENHPLALRALSAGRALWGNTPEVLREVRDPVRLAAAFRRDGVATPAVRWSAARRGAWIVKPRASGGGRRVRRWRAGSPLAKGRYLQAFVDGTPGSIVFVAASGRAVPLGLSRQLVGDASFGAAGFEYCGNILVPAADRSGAFDARTADRACRLARIAARAFGLVGVSGVDFIARAGVAHPLEVNPRWSASMELVERAYGLSVFAAHAAACAHGVLPDFDLRAARRSPCGAVGKAVVFARRDVRAGDTSPWLSLPGVRDVPRPGDVIRAGHPICTVLAAGRDADECHVNLVTQANWVYANVRAWERRAA